MSFPGFVVIAADIDRFWVDSWMADGDFGRPMGPPFLNALEERLRLEAGVLDAIALADPLEGDPPIELKPWQSRPGTWSRRTGRCGCR